MVRDITKQISLVLAMLIGIALCHLLTLQTHDSHSLAFARSNAEPGETQQIGKINMADLPPEGQDILKLIEHGGPFPYPKDGTVFRNRERLLPRQPRGYYKEYTVKTPGVPHRGARRIIAGSGGEFYYTDDHYRTFKLIVE